MIVMRFLHAVIRYCNDLTFFMAISLALLGLFLIYDVDKSHEISTVVRTPEGAGLNGSTNSKTIDGIDEGHSSFLLVSTPELSQNDIPLLGSGFKRLRAQSIKTVQALIENRRLMAQKSAAIRARKERIKRSNIALQSRRPNF